MKSKVLKGKKVCLRCGYEWRSALVRPKQCPSCKQPRWDTKARLSRAKKGVALKMEQDAIFDAIGAMGRK